MAFTLGFHIILASLGVALPAMMLIANYRGLRRDDPVALGLARRWSKVGGGDVRGRRRHRHRAVVRVRACCGRGSWARFGDVFGIPFAIEGIFFFLEAIFIAIYIFGWERLSPWAHFWTGVPVVIAGLGGAFSVVAVNAWMNQPRASRSTPTGTSRTSTR